MVGKLLGELVTDMFGMELVGGLDEVVRDEVELVEGLDEVVRDMFEVELVGALNEVVRESYELVLVGEKEMGEKTIGGICTDGRPAGCIIPVLV